MSKLELRIWVKFITVRKPSLRRLCFYKCLSVHRRRVVSQHALQVSGPTPKGEVEGFGLGGSRGPHPGVSQHALRQAHPPAVDGYCCGQYASYWNAFLFLNGFVSCVFKWSCSMTYDYRHSMATRVWYHLKHDYSSVFIILYKLVLC